MKKTELKATLQKSYYGKATVFEDENYIVLHSYNTDVIAIDKHKNKIVRLWSGWSSTTAKHINDFLMQNGFNKLSKKEWIALPCVNPCNTYNIYISNGFFTHKSNILLTDNEIDNEIDRISENSNYRLTAWAE